MPPNKENNLAYWFWHIRKAVKYLLVLIILFIVYINYHIIQVSRDRLFNDPKDLPFNEAGLLLGTSQKLSSGKPNPFFDNRIEAAAELYKTGRINYIIASGNAERRYYNEPLAMKESLLLKGIPENKILLDEKGFSTIDSVVRCIEVYKQASFTIISQKFHNQRAVYLAQAKGADSCAYNARDVEFRSGAKTLFREIFARVKAFYDLHIYRYSPPL